MADKPIVENSGNKDLVEHQSSGKAQIATPTYAGTINDNRSSTSSIPSTSTPDLDTSSFSAEVSQINSPHSVPNIYKPPFIKLNMSDEKNGTNKNLLSKNRHDFKSARLTRKQAELYIANQVELLQTAEVHAESPEQIDQVVKTILRYNPDLAQAHFLSYMNCLRVKDYCDAVHNLNKCFNGMSTISMNRSQTDPLFSGSLPNLEDCNKGFRYAALNLAALHARFNHKDEAAAALREAVMMAQESNDHVCLQHALSWLYRIQPESERLKLVERCISKSQDLGLTYLQSLGEQAMSQFTAMIGLSGPDTVMEILTRSDILNCQHSMIELVTSSYSQKSAFWSMYGRSHMTATVSQLLLNLDNSSNSTIGGKMGSQGIYVTAEATAISLSNLIRHFHDRGEAKMADKIIDLATSLFQNDSSICGEIVRRTSLYVEFERSLHKNNWSKAAAAIAEAEAFSSMTIYLQSGNNTETNNHMEALFMRLQLNIYRGDAEAAAKVRSTISEHESSNNNNTETSNPHQKVRLLLLEAEMAGMTNSYSNAIPPLIQAASLSDKHFMHFHGAMIALHTAHVQLQLGLSSRALDLVKRCLPTVLAHGSIFECGRAKLLLAKCLVAAAPRGKFLKAIKAIFPNPIKFLYCQN